MNNQDERFSRNQQKYFTLNYDNVSEKGLKKLTTALDTNKQPVAEVIASNTATKVNGAMLKKAVLILDGGQTVTLLVGPGGDITQTKLNSTVIPVDTSTLANYAKDLAKQVDANQLKFEKAMARKAAAAIKDTSDVKPAAKSMKQRIAEAQSALDTANSNLDAEKSRLSQAQTNAATSNSKIEQLKAQLNGLKAQESQLIDAIQAMGGAV